MSAAKSVQSIYIFQVLNDKLVKLSHAFHLVRDGIQAIGQRHYETMHVADLRDMYHKP